MTKYLKAHEDFIKQALLTQPAAFDWVALKAYHLTRISFLQHERLIHLMVTLSFAIFLFISLGIMFYHPAIEVLILIALLLILQDESPSTGSAAVFAPADQPVSSQRFVVVEEDTVAGSSTDYADRFSGEFDIDSVTAGNCEVLAKRAYQEYNNAQTSCDRSRLFSAYSRIKDRCEELARN